MKTYKFLIITFFSLLVISSCEIYPDVEVDHTPIFPLSGEWRVRIIDLSTGDTVVTIAASGAVTRMYTFGTYNTADNVTNQMWIRTTTNIGANSTWVGFGTLRGKINCDVPSLSFNATDIRDISHASATFSITEAKITLSAITMPSKAVADKISFKYTTSKQAGKTFLVEGYRRTLWPEDETYIKFHY